MNIHKLMENLEKRGFTTAHFAAKEEAVSYLQSQISGKTVAFGGSMTLKEMGLDKALAENNSVIWHWNEPGRETLLKAREAEVYLCSANAVAETGELVNIDGTGNRVSMTLFGPEKLYFVVGVNKIAEDLPAAMERARNVAAPKNAVRIGGKTPCAVKGVKCYRCESPDNICHATVILERPVNGMKAEVVLIDEELGY